MHLSIRINIALLLSVKSALNLLQSSHAAFLTRLLGWVVCCVLLGSSGVVGVHFVARRSSRSAPSSPIRTEASPADRDCPR